MKPVESDFDLPRLSESSDPLLGRVVGDLRQHQPDITELASLASQLAVRGITVTAAVSPPTPSVAASAAKKWLLAGGGAASVLVAWLAFRSSPSQEPRVLSPASVQPVNAHLAERGGPVAATPRTVGGAAVPPIAASVALPPGMPLAPEAAAAAAAAVAVEKPPLVPSGSAAPAAAEPAPRESTTRAPSSAVSSIRPAATPQPLPAASDAPTEIELLRDARLALKSSPTKALELAESHARAFPGGRLAQERELIAISSLVALGRRTAALSRASRFEQSFPLSPYRKQIAELLR